MGNWENQNYRLCSDIKSLGRLCRVEREQSVINPGSELAFPGWGVPTGPVVTVNADRKIYAIILFIPDTILMGGLPSIQPRTNGSVFPSLHPIQTQKQPPYYAQD